MPYQREAALVLAMWRDVERQLEAATPETPEAETLQAEASRLRHEYHRLIDEARRFHRPEPPPFPRD